MPKNNFKPKRSPQYVEIFVVNAKPINKNKHIKTDLFSSTTKCAILFCTAIVISGVLLSTLLLINSINKSPPSNPSSPPSSPPSNPPSSPSKAYISPSRPPSTPKVRISPNSPLESKPSSSLTPNPPYPMPPLPPFPSQPPPFPSQPPINPDPSPPPPNPQVPSGTPNSPPPPTTPPLFPPPYICNNECTYRYDYNYSYLYTYDGRMNYIGDGDCDDGGAGSEYNTCLFGTDCDDCGVRIYTPPFPPSLPPEPPSPPPNIVVTVPSTDPPAPDEPDSHVDMWANTDYTVSYYGNHTFDSQNASAWWEQEGNCNLENMPSSNSDGRGGFIVSNQNSVNLQDGDYVLCLYEYNVLTEHTHVSAAVHSSPPSTPPLPPTLPTQKYFRSKVS
jgi:hypothetical protein